MQSQTKSRWMTYNIWLLVCLSYSAFLGFYWGDLPALGPLLSPFTGVWQNGPDKKVEFETFKFNFLESPVEVYWDEYSVPHIFAQSDNDAFAIQGYLHAKDRLFQMDLQSRPGAGEISELVGKRALEYDRFFVSIGIRQAAQAAFEEIMKDADTRSALEAYSSGVNHWIQNLSSKKLPVEYKILGVSPSLWSPLRVAHLLKIMSFRLAGRSYDLHLTRHLQRLGFEKVEDLFPDFIKDAVVASYPSIPNGHRSKNEDKQRVNDFITDIKMFPDYLQPFATNGSNNWAVGPDASSDGQVLLVNDPHLRYSIPAIWYEQQIRGDRTDIYGVGFVGAPGVQIGFNKTMGWGVTNGTTDVLDWYELEFKDSESLEYRIDGEWKTAEVKYETLKIKGQSASEKVKILWTEFGVVVHREGKLGLAMDWMAYRPSNEVKAFLGLNRARNHDDCRKALNFYKSPAQNFICADKTQVSITHAGEFPLRYLGQGRYVLNGRLSENRWNGTVPQEFIPRNEKPKDGIVYSANQRVVGPEYDYYLGWDYDESYRAARIRHWLLDKSQPNSFEKMKQMQQDVYDPHAAIVIPLMGTAIASSGQLNNVQTQVIKDLLNWDFQVRIDQPQGSIYKVWWRQFEKSLYADELGERKDNLYPRRQRTAQFLKMALKGEEVSWVDNIATLNGKEQIKDLLLQSFVSAYEQLKNQFGEYGEAWNYSHFAPTHLPHIAYIPGLEVSNLAVGGSRYSLNANTGKHGPTWRMIIEWGNNGLRAEVNYPGGQTGNPFSKNYDEFAANWAVGEYRKIYFFDTLPEQTQASLQKEAQ